uniref:Integrase core domain containing protein n=1 Tax=Solanum tuberosum TaxID=4113 RepID=M1DT71_SOLTU
MATLLQHVRPWMQRSITEFKVRMETKMDRSVQAVHKHLDAFKLRVLTRSTPVTNFSSIRTELDSLWAGLDTILVPSTDEPASAPTVVADDTLLDALFRDDVAQPEPTHARGKSHCSSHISDTIEDARAKKWERQQNEQARRASIVDKELCQQRVNESALGALSSSPTTEAMIVVGDDVSTNDGAVRMNDSTTDGVVIDDVGTTEDDPSVVPAGSRKPDPPAC